VAASSSSKRAKSPSKDKPLCPPHGLPIRRRGRKRPKNLRDYEYRAVALAEAILRGEVRAYDAVAVRGLWQLATDCHVGRAHEDAMKRIVRLEAAVGKGRDA
jgi:hypothetical protein